MPTLQAEYITMLGAFAHTDACPLLITSIVAVKPEDQDTFFQNFLGLSGYLCPIGGFDTNTALLPTRNAQNHNEAQRLALVAGGGSQPTKWKKLLAATAVLARHVPPGPPARIVGQIFSG